MKHIFLCLIVTFVFFLISPLDAAERTAPDYTQSPNEQINHKHSPKKVLKKKKKKKTKKKKLRRQVDQQFGMASDQDSRAVHPSVEAPVAAEVLFDQPRFTLLKSRAPKRPAPVQYSQHKLGVAYGRMSGYTQYDIGNIVTFHDSMSGDSAYRVPDPMSRLCFPMDTPVIKLTDQWTFSAGRVRLELMKNIPGYTGKTQDSDWLNFYGIKDIFSLSDTRLMLWGGAATFWTKVPQFHLFFGEDECWVGAGYQYVHSHFDISNVVETYPSSPTRSATAMTGAAATYDDADHFFSLFIEYNLVLGQLSLMSRAGYIPLVYTHNEDDHILRGKLSKADTSGHGYSLSGTLLWQIDPHFSVDIAMDYLRSFTQGTQKQTHYNYIEATNLNDWVEIQQKAELELSQVVFGLHFYF